MRDELDVELVFRFVGPGDQSANLTDFLYSEDPTSGLGYPDWVRSRESSSSDDGMDTCVICQGAVYFSIQKCPHCGVEPKDIEFCTRCGKHYTGFPALSRVDNKTSICSPCGTEEAMQDFAGETLSPLDKVEFPERTMPISTVIHILETINTCLVSHEDQEAWTYVQVVLKSIKDGEI